MEWGGLFRYPYVINPARAHDHPDTRDPLPPPVVTGSAVRPTADRHAGSSSNIVGQPHLFASAPGTCAWWLNTDSTTFGDRAVVTRPTRLGISGEFFKINSPLNSHRNSLTCTNVGREGLEPST